jgi:hypothetical protein
LQARHLVAQRLQYVDHRGAARKRVGLQRQSRKRRKYLVQPARERQVGFRRAQNGLEAVVELGLHHVALAVGSRDLQLLLQEFVGDAADLGDLHAQVLAAADDRFDYGFFALVAFGVDVGDVGRGCLQHPLTGVQPRYGNMHHGVDAGHRPLLSLLPAAGAVGAGGKKYRVQVPSGPLGARVADTAAHRAGPSV